MSTQSQVEQNIEALGDRSVRVRKQAAINLRTLSPHSEVPIKSLITALNDENPLVRRELAKTIAVIGGQSAVGVLIDAFNDKNYMFDDEMINLRKGVAEALGLIGGPKAFRCLISNIVPDEVYVAAAEALSNFGEPAVDVLRRMVKSSGNDGSVREQAIISLGKIGGSAIPVLIKFLDNALYIKSNYFFYRAVLAEALGKTRDSRAVPSLIKLLKQFYNMDADYNYSHNWQIAAVKALVRINDPAGIEAIKKVAANKKRYGFFAQEAALEALEKLRARHK